MMRYNIIYTYIIYNIYIYFIFLRKRFGFLCVFLIRTNYVLKNIFCVPVFLSRSLGKNYEAYITPHVSYGGRIIFYNIFFKDTFLTLHVITSIIQYQMQMLTLQPLVSFSQTSLLYQMLLKH